MKSRVTRLQNKGEKKDKATRGDTTKEKAAPSIFGGFSALKLKPL